MTYQFSNNWFPTVVRYWPNFFKAAGWLLPENNPKVILEVGSFEGQCTCWILNNLATHPDSKVVCVDPFSGSMEHTNQQKEELFERFQHNTSRRAMRLRLKFIGGFPRTSYPDH